MFANCLSSRKYEATVLKSFAEGQAIGVKEVPTFIIGNKQIVGSASVPYKTFKEAIDSELNANQNSITGNLVAVMDAISGFLYR